MIVVYDTETTGVPPKYHKGPSDPGMPHIVQLAAILLDDDWAERGAFEAIVAPEGWAIPDDVARVHGVTTDLATRFGVRLQVAMAMFFGFVARADEVAAHNIEYDNLMVNAELHRLGRTPAGGTWPPKKPVCTKELSMPVLNLPPTAKMIAAGFRKPKPPTLTEAHVGLFGEAFDGAHSALADVRACARILRHLRSGGGLYSSPAIPGLTSPASA